MTLNSVTRTHWIKLMLRSSILWQK